MPLLDLRIPKGHRSAFATLLTYDRERLDALFSALRELTPTLFVQNSARALAKRVGIPEKDALQLLTVLASLFSLRDQPGISEAELPDKLLSALEEEPEIGLTEPKKAPLRGFLSQVLSLGKSLGVTAKPGLVVAIQN
jgi:hypothetical protein